MPLLLCGHIDKRTQWTVVVDHESFTVGCSGAATVPVPDASLASQEVLIRRQADRYVLRDLAEKGRVSLREAVTREGVLKSGDRIRIGRILMLFYENAHRDHGQVDLYRDDPPGGTSRDSPFLFEGYRKGPPEPEAPRKPLLIPTAVWGVVLGSALAAGVLVGILARG